MQKQTITQIISNMIWIQPSEGYGHWQEAPPGIMSFVSPSEISVDGIVYKYDSCKILALGENESNISHELKVVWSKQDGP